MTRQPLVIAATFGVYPGIVLATLAIVPVSRLYPERETERIVARFKQALETDRRWPNPEPPCLQAAWSRDCHRSSIK